MTCIAVRCPHCQSDQIVKRGKTARGTQRYLCQNTRCPKGSFLLDSCNRGCLPEVKQTIIDMSLNASGVCDTARSLRICPNTVLRELEKNAGAAHLPVWGIETSRAVPRMIHLILPPPLFPILPRLVICLSLRGGGSIRRGRDRTPRHCAQYAQAQEDQQKPCHHIQAPCALEERQWPKHC
jgi:transposase-like protein